MLVLCPSEGEFYYTHSLIYIEGMGKLPVTEFLVNNAKNYKDKVALVEINPEIQEKSRKTRREYELIQPNSASVGRCEMYCGESVVAKQNEIKKN